MALSVVLATYNEENNLRDCLESVKDIASEIIIVDGSSTDDTVKIAKEFGAHVTIKDNPRMFHINKQLALEKATHMWILQLDADERVSVKLGHEIKKVTEMSDTELEVYQSQLPDKKLFLRNQEQWLRKQGKFSEEESTEIVGFFIPRLNYFLGKYLRYGGVYPDGAIRLVKKNKAHFPCRDVHEIIQLKGKVGWLQNPLLHIDSPTFTRYLQRNSRYINLIMTQMREDKLNKNISQFFQYVIYKPLHWFVLTFFLFKGFRDGWQGFIFSLFSALRFPRAYIRYLKSA